MVLKEKEQLEWAMDLEDLHRDNLPDKIKDGAYVINLDEYSDIGTHWIALYVNAKTIIPFDSFGVEHIPKKSKHFF